jgi:SAM-dependent methyltransferase
MSDREPVGDVQQRHVDNAQRYKRDFWATENRRFAQRHYRLNKVGRIVRQLVGAKECDLLDLGCGPGTLADLLPKNVHYYGIDIAIQEPAPNFLELDLLATPISFRDMKFDLVVAQGLFEYLADSEARKFAEIRDIVKPGGRFFVTYTNFAHRSANLFHAYSNVRPPKEFRRDLERYFTIERFFPGAYNWNHTHPNRDFMVQAQTGLDVDIPILGQFFAVDHFYICAPRPA